jgi:hypothetical protein
MKIYQNGHQNFIFWCPSWSSKRFGRCFYRNSFFLNMVHNNFAGIWRLGWRGKLWPHPGTIRVKLGLRDLKMCILTQDCATKRRITKRRITKRRISKHRITKRRKLQNVEFYRTSKYKTSKIRNVENYKKVGKTTKAWIRYKVRNLLSLPPVQYSRWKIPVGFSSCKQCNRRSSSWDEGLQ